MTTLTGFIAASNKQRPNAPTIGTATDVGTSRPFNNGAATVTFSAPSYDGKMPITSYTVTSSPGGFTASGGGSPLTVTGLASSTNYSFTATATNAIGTSVPSSASNTITATTVPQTPTIGTATRTNNTTVALTYTPNSNGGKAITAVSVTSSPSISLSVSGGGGSLTVTGSFSPGVEYSFQVTQSNANGTSGASAFSNAILVNITAYDSIASAISTAGQTVSFSSIPQTYKHLELRMVNRKQAAGTSVTVQTMRVNNDSTSGRYISQIITADSTTTITPQSGSSSSFNIGGASAQASADTNLFAASILTIYDYASTSKTKSMSYIAGGANYVSGGTTDSANSFGAIQYNSTSAISSIQLTTTVAANCVIALYGIA